MDFFKALRGKTDIRKKYAQMRRLCIAGILLLGFYAISAFPGYYEAGLNLNNCLMMGFVLLSAIVLFYLERAYSSKEGARPHDWNSSGGSMHAFSFVRAFCPGCGARLGLAGQKAGELPVFCAPGKVLSEELKFTCPHCRWQYEEEQVVQEYGASSKLSGARAAEIMKEIKGLHPFRLCAEYTRHYLLITIILLLVQISCIYFARLRPVNLLLPLFVVYFLFGKANSEMFPVYAMYAGIGAVLGHNYPFYMNFKGGKGIAATAGIIVSTTNIWIVLICLVVFVGIVAITRYVSVGSLVVVIVYFISVVVYGQMGGFGVTGTHLYEIYILAAVLVVSAFYKHKENIKRLLSGTENKLSVGKKK